MVKFKFYEPRVIFFHFRTTIFRMITINVRFFSKVQIHFLFKKLFQVLYELETIIYLYNWSFMWKNYVHTKPTIVWFQVEKNLVPKFKFVFGSRILIKISYRFKLKESVIQIAIFRSAEFSTKGTMLTLK